MTVLGIDTSGKTASCAVMRDGLLLGQETVYTKLTHSQVILPFVQRLLKDVSLTVADIDLIAVAAGPGSYTGLRIGIAMVKGLCFGGKRCIGVSTLEALAENCSCAKARIFSVLSARPGIVYFGAYDSDGEKLKLAHGDEVMPVEAIKAYAEGYDGDIIIVGDCAEEVKTALFADDSRVRLAPAAIRLQQASSVCRVAVCHADEAGSPESLNAVYLQITKAEKDLQEKNNG